MVWLIAALAIGGIASAVGGILERKNQRNEATKKANQEKDQLGFQKQELEYQKNTALGTMEQELGLQKAETLANAADSDAATIAGFTSSMEDTYLSQLGAEAQYRDVLQQGEQAQGSITAAAGSGGIRGNDIVGNVIAGQFQEQAALKRKTIDSGIGASVTKAKTMADLSMGETARMRAQFDDGSAFMALYDYKRQRIQGAADIQSLAMEDQSSYLDSVIKDNKYNWNWFAADALGVTTAAANAYVAGYGATGGYGKAEVK